MITNPAGMAYKFLEFQDMPVEQEPVKRGLLTKTNNMSNKPDNETEMQKILRYVSMVRNARMGLKDA